MHININIGTNEKEINTEAKKKLTPEQKAKLKKAIKNGYGKLRVASGRLYSAIEDKIFDGRCVSYELGARKRERKPFGLLLDRFGLKAEECYFVDDLDLNIEAALECGFSAHQFTTVERFREALAEQNIL